MTTKLKPYFPILPIREELLKTIHSSSQLSTRFNKWSSAVQNEFLDFCTGAKGIKLLYDTFFKEVMNPEYTPERLEEFLSVVLQKKVGIVRILPNDSTRIADESSLLITDIIVLYAQSPKEFHSFSDYYHHSKQVFNTGLPLNLLQEFIMIPLDIFRQKMDNKPIATKLDAWLTFLSSDNPDKIIELITTYPEFKAMYETLYQTCQNVEKVMHMFSEELRILDRNTVTLMVEEQQKEIDLLKLANEEKDSIIEQLRQQIASLQK